jgi:hypothetical protein
MRNKTSGTTRGGWPYFDWRGFALIALAVAAIVLNAFIVIGLTATQDLADAIVITPEVVEQTIPDVVIKVDNIGCVIAEVPVITYYVATDTARVTIECDSDILFNYLPALVEEVGEK